MRSKAKRRLTTIIAALLCALSGVFAGSARPTALADQQAAAPSPTACRSDAQFRPGLPNYWSFSVDFDDGSTDGCLILTGDSVDAVTYHPVACALNGPAGSITVVAGKANFNGSGYLTCEVNLKTYLRSIPDVALYNDGFFVQTAISNLAESNSLLLGNALFYHPSVSYYSPRGAPSGPAAIHMLTSVINRQTYSTMLGTLPINAGYALRAQTACMLVGCTHTHRHNNALIQTWATPGPVAFDTTKTTFWVGASALKGSGAFVGTLDYLTVDPSGGRPSGGT